MKFASETVPVMTPGQMFLNRWNQVDIRFARRFQVQRVSFQAQFDMFNNPDYKSQMAVANAKMPKKGVPLRWEAKTVSTDEKGKQETSTSVMEMTNFKAGNIPASEFQIPADYKKVEMTMTAEAGAPVDSASSGPKPNAKDAAKDAAAGAANKLKGIFGGKKK